MFSTEHSRVSRMSSGIDWSRFEVSSWHWELWEVLSWRHHRSSACFSPWFSFARNWYDQFLATPRSKARRHSVFTCHFSQFPVLIENIFPHVLSGDFFHAWNTSNFRRKLELDWSFQLVSYLGSIRTSKKNSYFRKSGKNHFLRNKFLGNLLK
jgi:hypothetical protein